jgi:hypothetical protein
LIYLGFITEGKLAAIFITPSLGVPNWPVIYIINTKPPACNIAGSCKLKTGTRFKIKATYNNITSTVNLYIRMLIVYVYLQTSQDHNNDA